MSAAFEAIGDVYARQFSFAIMNIAKEMPFIKEIDSEERVSVLSFGAVLFASAHLAAFKYKQNVNVAAVVLKALETIRDEIDKAIAVENN